MKLFAPKTKNQFAPRSISLPNNRRKNSRLWLWVLLAMATIALLVVGWQLLQTKLFRVKEVKVEQLVLVKPHVVPNEQLQRLANGLRGSSLLLLNEQETIEEWMARMPALDKMFLRKEYPDTLVIQYVPRVAFSQLVSPTSGFLVDREGFIFAKSQPVDYLPKVITDQKDVNVGQTTSARGLRLAQHLIEGLRNTNPRLISILFRDNWLELTMTGNPRLLISEDKAAVPTLREILVLFDKFVADDKYPQEVDMRYDRPVLRY